MVKNNEKPKISISNNSSDRDNLSSIERCLNWNTLIYYKMDGTKLVFSKYEITSSGIIRNKSTKKIKKYQISGGYYTVNLISDENKLYVIYVHILVASTFLGERPTDYFVDHINRNRLDNSINNLRYTTPKDNNLNRDCKKSKNIKTIYIGLDMNNIIRQVIYTNYNSRRLPKLNKLLNWSKITLDCFNLLKNLNLKIENLFNLEFIETKEKKGVFISNIGIIKSVVAAKSITYYSIGHTNDCGYKEYGKEKLLIHRLVAKYFLNDGNDLKDLIIDHIDTDRLNNSVNNLRICKNNSENLSNINTIAKLSQKIKCKDSNNNQLFFISKQSCSDYIKLSIQTINRQLNNKLKNKRSKYEYHDFEYWTKEDELNYINGEITIVERNTFDITQQIIKSHPEISLGICIELVSGEFLYFSGINHTSQYTKLSKKTIFNQLYNKVNGLKDSHKYKIIRLWSKSEWELYDLDKIKLSPKTNIIEDIKEEFSITSPLKYFDGKKFLYFSNYNSAEKYFNIKTRTLYRRIKDKVLIPWEDVDYINFKENNIILED